MRRKLSVVLALMLSAVCFLTGCQASIPSPGDIEGYDDGEEYLSIWVHTIEDTDEGRCYKESVHKFNEAYNGEYFADIEFIPRNDSGGGYSDKINASVMSGGLPDVITVDGPNIAAYAVNNIIQPLAPLTEQERNEYLESISTECPTFLEVNTIETTGAGDTFMACVLDAVLRIGLDSFDEQSLHEMLEFANAASSIITTRKGALKVMPEKSEILKLIAERKKNNV